jgi:hypothetical protein
VPVEKVGGTRIDGLRLSELMPRQINDVNQLFDHLTAGARALTPPVRMQGIAMELANEQADSAGLSRHRGPIPALDSISESIHESAGRDDVGPSCRIRHRSGSRQIQRDGLLDEQMNTRARRCLDLARVRERRQRDDQQIECLRIQHASIVRVRGSAELPGKLADSRFIAATAGDELHERRKCPGRLGVPCADASTTEQPNTQRIH